MNIRGRVSRIDIVSADPPEYIMDVCTNMYGDLLRHWFSEGRYESFRVFSNEYPSLDTFVEVVCRPHLKGLLEIRETYQNPQFNLYTFVTDGNHLR